MRILKQHEWKCIENKGGYVNRTRRFVSGCVVEKRIGASSTYFVDFKRQRWLERQKNWKSAKNLKAIGRIDKEKLRTKLR